MSRIAFVSLLAIVAATTACSQDTPTSTEAPDGASHSGYVIRMGNNGNECVDETTGLPLESWQCPES